MLAFGRPSIPERGVAQVTRSISEFFTPLNLSGVNEDITVKFCARIGPSNVCLVMTNCPPGHVTS